MIRQLNEYGRQYRPSPKFEGFVLHFKTPEAKSLFDNELAGQISDGMYENKANEATFKFWNAADTVADGTNKITKGERTITELPYGVKDGFAFNGLFAIKVVGDRMLEMIKSEKNPNPTEKDYRLALRDVITTMRSTRGQQ